MRLLDRLAAALAWLRRHGANAVAISILLGIALPPLGALVRPFFPQTVFLLLCLAFLRVDPAALRAQFGRAKLLAAAVVWTMLIVPTLAGLILTAAGVGDRSPGLLLALMLNAVAPPIFASPALAALMGLNAATTLALLLACIVVTPILAPAMVAVFVTPLMMAWAQFAGNAPQKVRIYRLCLTVAVMVVMVNDENKSSKKDSAQNPSSLKAEFAALNSLPENLPLIQQAAAGSVDLKSLLK